MNKAESASVKIVVSVGSQTREYPLGHEAIKNLIWERGEMPLDDFFWGALATHPSAEVRAGAAGSSDFAGGEDLLRGFLRDPSVDVRAAAIERHPDDLLGFMSAEELINIIRNDDIKVVKAIAENLRSYREKKGLSDVMDVLGMHPDPAIRLCVANDDRADKKRLAALSKDDDPEVAYAAKRGRPDR